MNVYSMLGLAQRAGKIISGEQAVEIALKKSQVKCVLLSTDSGKNTQNKFTKLAEFSGVPWYFYGLKHELGQSVGKSPRSVVAITDPGFAATIMTNIGPAE